MYNLTDQQADLIKDVLKVVGEKIELERYMAARSGHTLENFRMVADNAFLALGNGRVTVVDSSDNPLYPTSHDEKTRHMPPR